MRHKNQADAVISAFLEDADKTQEKIINRSLPNPDDDAETRIMKRFSRDMQLIIVNAAKDLGALPTNDSIGKAVVLIARSMLQGVAAITSPFTNDEEAVEYFLRFFAKEIDRSKGRKEDDDE